MDRFTFFKNLLDLTEKNKCHYTREVARYMKDILAGKHKNEVLINGFPLPEHFTIKSDKSFAFNGKRYRQYIEMLIEKATGGRKNQSIAMVSPTIFIGGKHLHLYEILAKIQKNTIQEIVETVKATEYKIFPPDIPKGVKVFTYDFTFTSSSIKTSQEADNANRTNKERTTQNEKSTLV